MKFLSTFTLVTVVLSTAGLLASNVSAQTEKKKEEKENWIIESTVEVTIDSLVVPQRSADSLVRYEMLSRKPEEPRPKQLATMREIDLTNDSVPEVLRIDGKVIPETDKIQFEFTIKQKSKVIYRDKWTAGGYFDPADKLNDSIRFSRLRRIITVFFANENFLVLDSGKYAKLLAESSPAEVVVNSPESSELLSGDRVMYSVFAGRDNFYGLIWLPSKKRFVKAWQN